MQVGNIQMGRSKFYVFIIIVLLIGCVIGAMVYPTKTITRTVYKEKASDIKTIQDLKEKIASLKTTLIHTNTKIIEKPDGSKETVIVSDTKSVTDIKKEHDSQLTELKKEVEALRQKERIEVNKKTFSVGLGIDTSRDYYGRISYDILPFLSVGANASLSRGGVDLSIKL